MLGAAPRARLLVVLTYRSAEVGAGHPLAAVLDALERDRRLTRLELHGLPEADVRRFLPAGARGRAGRGPRAPRSARPATRSSCASWSRCWPSGGSSGGDGVELPALVPERVREVVGRRLEPLDPATREVLAIAGVAGRPFTIAGVARVGGLGRESVAVALEPALAGRLVEPRADAPGRFGFAHAIVRDAVYDELTPALRAKLHAAFAAVLQESLEAGGEATAAEAAHHALAGARCGADPQAAWALSLEAAREAAALHAHAEAAAHYAGALEALELGAEVSSAERLDATMALAAASFAAGDIDAARRRFAAVASAARRSGAAELQARAALGFSQVQQYGVIDEEAIALLQGALDALPPADSALRARAAARLGQRLDPVTDQSRREALVDEGVAMARRLGDDETLLGAAHRRRPGQLAAGPCGRPRRRDRRGPRPRRARLGPGGRLLGADAAAARRARGGRRSTRVDAELAQLARLSAESRRGYFRWCLLVLQSARAAFAGRLAEGARLADEAEELNRRHGGSDAGAHRGAARPRAPAPASRRGAARRPARLRGPACGAPGVGGDARPGRVGHGHGGRAPGGGDLRARRLRRAPAQPRLALRARPARRAGRGVGHAGPGRGADGRARGPRRPQRGDGRGMGRVRAGRATARGARRGRRPARTRRPRGSGARSSSPRAGRRRAGSSRRSPTGCAAARRAPRRAARAASSSRARSTCPGSRSGSLRPRCRSSRSRRPRGRPRSRPRSRPAPSPRPSCSGPGSRSARSRRARPRG